jgi:ATP-dependent DNA helicase PIF1
MNLTTNMRVLLANDVDAAGFDAQLLEVGNGRVPIDEETGEIRISPELGTTVSTNEELCDIIYPNIAENFDDNDWLCERAILAPRNDVVCSINNILLDKLPGERIDYMSIDTVVDQDHAVHYPTEFLNSLEPSGFPPHKLLLKVGAPIMLLRNLDAPKLCNGTRLKVKQLMPHVIEATILSGAFRGEDVFIPRIPMIPTDTTCTFKRLQFPIKLSFAMTINKSQGQTLKLVGLHLLLPCFSHGQLYVGCSRVGSRNSLFILTPNFRTKNVVYPLALQ